MSEDNFGVEVFCKPGCDWLQGQGRNGLALGATQVTADDDFGSTLAQGADRWKRSLYTGRVSDLTLVQWDVQVES